MRIRHASRMACITLMGIAVVPCLAAPDGAAPADTPNPQPQTTAPKPAFTPSPYHYAVEYFYGSSDMAGKKTFHDGMWAGATPIYPSTAVFGWDNGHGSAFQVGAGLGELFNGSARLFDQPSEAWYKTPAGKMSVTVGKFWIPFASNEWEIETLPGVMLQWADHSNTFSFAANYDTNTKHQMNYGRFGHSFGKSVTLGLSAANGKCLSLGSDHNLAWGADGSISWAGWKLSGEYVGMHAPGFDPFYFTMGKLAYEKLGSWRPYVSTYAWNDTTPAFGRFRSSLYGLNYKINAALALEGAYSATSNGEVSWVQMHFTYGR